MDPAHPTADTTAHDAGPDRTRYSTSQVLLGVLISAQIVYLLASNLLNLLSSAEAVAGHETPGKIIDHLSGGIGEKKGHWYDAYGVLGRWEQVGNARQSWRMFAPDVGNWFSFVRVEMRWDAAGPGEPAAPGARQPVTLKGMDEPDDMYHYRRSGPWRFQRYEDLFMAIDFRVRRGEETERQALARWKAKIVEHLGWQWDSTSAYLNWRWRKYKKEHPECPTPQQMILLVHGYHVAPADEDFGKIIGPNVVPIARWEIGNTPFAPGTWAAIQAWDPETQRWTNRK